MQKIIIAIVLAMIALPAVAATTKKKVTSFALQVPSYAVQANRVHAETRKQSALQWYSKHLANRVVKK